MILLINYVKWPCGKIQHTTKCLCPLSNHIHSQPLLQRTFFLLIFCLIVMWISCGCLGVIQSARNYLICSGKQEGEQRLLKSPLVCWIIIKKKMQYQTMRLLYSLRCNQCLAWLDFMASSIAVTEMLKSAALTSQLPRYPVTQISLQIKLTPPSLWVFAESDSTTASATSDAPSTQNRFMEEHLFVWSHSAPLVDIPEASLW